MQVRWSASCRPQRESCYNEKQKCGEWRYDSSNTEADSGVRDHAGGVDLAGFARCCVCCCSSMDTCWLRLGNRRGGCPGLNRWCVAVRPEPAKGTRLSE